MTPALIQAAPLQAHPDISHFEHCGPLPVELPSRGSADGILIRGWERGGGGGHFKVQFNEL